MNIVEQKLDQLVDSGLPGAGVYIEDSNGTSMFFTAGVANLSSRQPITPDMHYRVGSTTKTFTAVLTLQLVSEGKLALNDTLQTLFPDVAIPHADALTVEHLLRMRSGLFDFVDDSSLQGLEANRRPYRLQRIIELAIREPAEFEPGTRFEYCNTNFCLLELIIERITGNTLGEELTHRILKPLGLTSTYYPAEDDLELPEPYVRGYNRTDSQWTECSHVFFGRGDGALISTPRDIATFFHSLLTEQILLPESLLEKMTMVVPDSPPAEMAYGLGLIRESLPCGVIWGHSGYGFGYGHLPFLNPEHQRFALFMLNGTFGFPESKMKPRELFSPEFRSQVYELSIRNSE